MPAFPLLRFGLALMVGLWLSGYTSAQPLRSDSSSVRFGRILVGDTARRSLSLTNGTADTLRLTGLQVSDTAFAARLDTNTVAPGDRLLVELSFTPRHNVSTEASLFLGLDRAPGWLPIDLRGAGRYAGTYYRATRDLYGQALKTELSRIIAAGYVALGYSTARDRMFMRIDNQRLNGQGASVNTLEGVYTGRTRTGYADRQEAQGPSGSVFNTEHTFPQSKYDSDEPMRSDLHHLFPTSSPANSRRGNDPFGRVTSPDWQVGGSRSGGNRFEPRDAQKGATARAMMYFVLRYRDYANFYAPQENTLLQWHRRFPPDRVERVRNRDIFRYQKNRNPFVDHPELMERIGSLVGVSQPPARLRLAVSGDSLLFGRLAPDSAAVCSLYLSATGNRELRLSDWAISGDGFSLDSTPETIQAGKTIAVGVRFKADSVGQRQGRLRFRSNAPGREEVELGLRAEVSRSTSLAAPEEPGPGTLACVALEDRRWRCHWESKDFSGEAAQWQLIDAQGRSWKATVQVSGRREVELRLRREVAGPLWLRARWGKTVLTELLWQTP